jgi:hypothetical protein
MSRKRKRGLFDDLDEAPDVEQRPSDVPEEHGADDES